MRNILFTFCVFSLLLFSCDDEETINPDGFKENTVRIDGGWQLNIVIQNNIDITDRFDFQSTNLVFSYSDEGIPTAFELTSSNETPLPIFAGSGNWAFDDLTYPTELSFTGSNGTTTLLLTGLPLQTGGSNLAFEVDYSCGDNTYVYSFKKN